MKRRQNNDAATSKVCAFRLDDATDKALVDLATTFGTTPNKYAQAIVRKHLSANGKETVPSSATLALDELGRYLTQIRDELIAEAENQRKCLDALTSRLQALYTLLADFLANTEKV